MLLKLKNFFLLSGVCLLLCNCSSTLEGLVIDSMANSINDDQNVALTGEEDPDLMGDALPFMLKMNEIMMSSAPDNADLKFAAARGFTTYANKWLEYEAKRIEELEYDKAAHLRKRAKAMYLRAKNYGFAGLELEYENFVSMLKANPKLALQELEQEDVPVLTWTGLAWMSYISQSTDDPSIMVELPLALKMLERALELDEKYEAGFLHEFFVVYYGSSVGGSQSYDQAKYHFDRALQISNGQKCSVYLTWATAYGINHQKEEVFDEMLEKALNVDPDNVPSFRLANKLCHREAKWYKNNKENYFL